MEADDLVDLNFNMFKQMKSLAENQERLAREDQMGEYLALANKREQLKNEISANNRRYKLLVKRDPSKSSKRKNISEEISEVIRSIQELDKRIDSLISDGKRRLISDISKMRRGRNAVRNYGRKKDNTPRFIERKG